MTRNPRVYNIPGDLDPSGSFATGFVATHILDNSNVSHGLASVATALETLSGLIAALEATTAALAASDIANDSVVVGVSVKDALNSLRSSILGLANTIASLTASQIGNDSTVSGAHVRDALNTLSSSIATVSSALTALVASQVGNDSTVTGAKVKDALNTLKSSIAALVTGVSSVFGRSNAVTAQNADYAAFYLNRGANDFNTFSQKPSPTGADLVLIEDQAAGGAKKYATITGCVSGASGNPYIDPPASPNAFDDEFSSGSPDFAVRGWTVVSGTTVQTRSGDINPWNVAGPAANTYWSTIIGSWIFVQAPIGVQLDIYKNITLANGDTYFARMGGSLSPVPGGPGRYNEVGVYAASGAGVDNNNRVYSTISESNTTTTWITYDMFAVAAGSSAGFSRLGFGGWSFDVRGVRFDQVRSYYPLMLNSASGGVVTAPCGAGPQSGSVGVTPSRAAMRNLFSNSGGQTPEIWAIDYFRKKTANAWLIP
ncbi:MAG TPA: hypothetical protein VJS18_21125 [Paraburkholderia sp.]|nr:hypothetical protein [Paraburkholderia sp.]